MAGKGPCHSTPDRSFHVHHEAPSTRFSIPAALETQPRFFVLTQLAGWLPLVINAVLTCPQMPVPAHSAAGLSSTQQLCCNQHPRQVADSGIYHQTQALTSLNELSATTVSVL